MLCVFDCFNIQVLSSHIFSDKNQKTGKVTEVLTLYFKNVRKLIWAELKLKSNKNPQHLTLKGLIELNRSNTLFEFIMEEQNYVCYRNIVLIINHLILV